MTWVGLVPFSEIGMTQAKLDMMEELAIKAEKAGDNNYWVRTRAFVKSVSSRKLTSLTNYQRRWLTTIVLNLNVHLEKKAWRY